MDISDYQSLIEDVEDLAACAERRREGTISHEDFLRELKEDGIIQDRVAPLDKERSKAYFKERSP